jgi:hypothetical protein
MVLLNDPHWMAEYHLVVDGVSALLANACKRQGLADPMFE